MSTPRADTAQKDMTNPIAPDAAGPCLSFPWAARSKLLWRVASPPYRVEAVCLLRLYSMQ